MSRKQNMMLVGTRIISERVGNHAIITFIKKDRVTRVLLDELNLEDLFAMKRELNEVAKLILASAPAKKPRKQKSEIFIDEDFTDAIQRRKGKTDVLKDPG